MGELEDALARTERDAELAAGTAARLLRLLKRAQSAASSGNLGTMERAFSDADQALAEALESLQVLRNGWGFDFEGYATRGAFVEEILSSARAANLTAYESDGVVLAFPVLLRVLPAERAVRFDKARARNVRPTAVVREIARLQKRPDRLGTSRFLKTLLKAYLVETGGVPGRQVRLSRIQELLTLLPRKGDEEYTRQEFARDLYRLDRSNELVTDDEKYRCKLAASTGTRQNPIQVVGEDGRTRDYFVITVEAT